MNDEDLPMEDEGDRVIDSTELNDGPADDAAEYVDPMDVFTNPSISHLPKNAQIPPFESPAFPRSASHYVDSRSDNMVYDPRMRFHAELPSETSVEEIHPEDPRRIHSIFEEIREAGLVRGPEHLDNDEHDDFCWRIGIRPAEKHEILLIHTEAHYNFIASLPSMNCCSAIRQALTCPQI